MADAKRHDEPAVYEIRVKGILDPSWADWFDHFSLRAQEEQTALRGPVADQAALIGILTKLNDMGLLILAVTRVRRQPDPVDG